MRKFPLVIKKLNGHKSSFFALKHEPNFSFARQKDVEKLVRLPGNLRVGYMDGFGNRLKTWWEAQENRPDPYCISLNFGFQSECVHVKFEEAKATSSSRASFTRASRGGGNN